MADDSASLVNQDKELGNVPTENTEGGNEMPPDPVVLKALKIKSGVVKRLTKDKQSYEKEAAQQRTLLANYEAEGKDASILRNARECLKETEVMIPDCQRRLTTAVTELKELVDANRNTPVGKTPEFQEALRIVKEANQNSSKSQ